MTAGDPPQTDVPITPTVEPPNRITERTGAAPVTRRVLRRTAAIYLSLGIAGLVPSLVDASPGWRALGMGAWFPGAGFLASGDWSAALALPSLLLFMVGFMAWFGSGMVLGPILAWAGAAVVAAVVADDSPWAPAPFVVTGIVTAAAVVAAVVQRRRAAVRVERRIRRNEVLAEQLPKVLQRLDASIERRRSAGTPEMTEEQLAGVRYALDIALRPIDDWEMFDRIDQFQTSALRYQINQLGWALAVAQSAYAPSFHGALSQGQRQLIDRYLLPDVHGFWRWERAWGHLRPSADPIGRDNIMVTGYFGLNLALYMANTGDHRYLDDDSLPFRVSSRRSYPHSADDVQQSLLDNYADNADGFLLYPCEPNWIYSACNMRGAATLSAYDRLHGTDRWGHLRESFLRHLEEELMTTDGGVVALRSQLTGLPVPFPVPDTVLSKELNPSLPELAHRYWALVRDEALDLSGGECRVNLPGTNVDFGNYTISDSFALDGLFGSAREMGDHEVADAAMAAIEALGTKRIRDGVLHSEGGSTLVTATIAMDQLLDANVWRDTINEPTPESILTGPILEDVDYPRVLVASAVSDGRDLRLVLRPGTSTGRSTITIARLDATSTYAVTGAVDADVRSDDQGRATVEVDLEHRAVVHIRPAAAR